MTLVNQRYRILESLGRGGFGETYLVEDTQMPSHRRCVLKQLKPATRDPQTTQLVRERFAREAATLESLGEGHPQIPTLYAYFTENGQFYLVQEWIQGKTLSAWVQSHHQMSEAQVRSLLLNLLPVLEFIHQKGIVHRDIKPDNVILRDRDGVPVLIDFGAVRETMSTVMSSSGNPTSSIVIGTPGFMPSEQAAGRPLPSSDLYSLGLTAIFLLTGKLPQDIPADPRTGKLMWRSLVNLQDRQLVEVLDKAIEPYPRDRFPTAQEMLAALQSPHGVVPPPPSPTSDPTVAVAPGWSGTVPPTQPVRQPPSPRPAPTVLSQNQTATPPAKSSKKTGLLMGAVVGGVIGGSLIAALALQNDSRQTRRVATPTPTPTVTATPPPTLTPTPTPTPTPAPRSFYFLADSAYSDRSNARNRVDELQRQGYRDAGSFWLPDFPNLSDKQYTQVYVARFQDRQACLDLLQDYGRNTLDSYCALASTDDNADRDRISARDVIAQDTPLVPNDRPSPLDATQAYYTAINNQDYIQAWNTLSRELQADSDLHPKRFQSFEAWWTQVDRVNVNDLELVEVGEQEARVNVSLTYNMEDGDTGRDDLQILWKWDAANRRWVYDDARIL